MGGAVFEGNEKRNAGSISPQARHARRNWRGDIDTDSGAFRGPPGKNPGAKRGRYRGAMRDQKEETEESERRKRRPPAPRRARARPRAGILSAASARHAAHRRYQRLFRRTMPASPPLDSPVSLLNRFLRNSSNICIMCSRFPRHHPPPRLVLARAHTLTYTYSQAHPRTPPPPGRPRHPAGPGWVSAAAGPWLGSLHHLLARSPGRQRGRPRPAAGSPRAVPGRRSHASNTWAGEPRARRARSAESRSEGGHGRSGSRG